MNVVVAQGVRAAGVLLRQFRCARAWINLRVRLMSDERGLDTVEWSLIVICVVLAAILAMRNTNLLTDVVQDMFGGQTATSGQLSTPVMELDAPDLAATRSAGCAAFTIEFPGTPCP